MKSTIEAFKPFWVVYHLGKGNLVPRFATKREAKAEAARHARDMPEEVFVVLETVFAAVTCHPRLTALHDKDYKEYTEADYYGYGFSSRGSRPAEADIDRASIPLDDDEDMPF